MLNRESVLENDMDSIYWDWEIETDHLISARLPDQAIVHKKKENLLISKLPFQLPTG